VQWQTIVKIGAAVIFRRTSPQRQPPSQGKFQPLMIVCLSLLDSSSGVCKTAITPSAVNAQALASTCTDAPTFSLDKR
jgi:hypothetical protein